MREAPTLAVLSVGYDLPQLVAGAPPVQTFPEALERDDLDGVMEALATAMRHSGHALVIYPQWLGEPTERRLETIRSALSTNRLALHASALPPLAGGVLCNLAAALTAPLYRPGQLVGALAVLESKLVVVAWLASVSGLKQPSPSLVQHLGSMSPRSSYGVILQPEPAVVSIGRPGQGLDLQPAAGPMELVIAAREESDTSWLTDIVNPALGGLPTRTVPPSRHGPDWWGNARLAEAVAYPTELVDLTRDVMRRHRMRLCRWCATPIASSPCPFCRGADAAARPGRTPVAAERYAPLSP